MITIVHFFMTFYRQNDNWEYSLTLCELEAEFIIIVVLISAQPE